jgi:hypothetical protein
MAYELNTLNDVLSCFDDFFKELRSLIQSLENT